MDSKIVNLKSKLEIYKAMTDGVLRRDLISAGG